MRRRLKHLALFLVVGAAINYAIAMGIIWFSVVAWDAQQERWFNDARYQHARGRGLTVLRWVEVNSYQRRLLGITVDGEASLLPAWSRLRSTAHDFPAAMVAISANRLVERMEYAAGWPMRAMIYRYVDDRHAPYGDGRQIEEGIRLPPRPAGQTNWPPLQDRAIPFRIIPPGFALNTLLFASLAAIAWYAPPAIRRNRRRRANRCLKCGYAREGLDSGAPCPECGTPNSA